MADDTEPAPVRRYLATMSHLRRTLAGWLVAAFAGAASPPDVDERAPLPPCPSSPNCVSSEAPADDAVHHLAPLPLPDGLAPEAALEQLAAWLATQPRVELGTRTPLRLTATERSRVFRFVDDVVFRVDPDARLLHVRSASRVGHGDLGANRRRATRWFAALAETWGVDWTPAAP